jgi:hypothetical protein
MNEDLSLASMKSGPTDLAQVRLDNAMALFDEFVRQTARHADAATLRGLERRFAERVQVQPSYWSQIKGRSRQIGERLARQFEHLCHKPAGWLDQTHDPDELPSATGRASAMPGDGPVPRDDDERFIVGLVLSYYRRHPQRARTRLLDLLGEVLTPTDGAMPPSAPHPRRSATVTRQTADEAHALWLGAQSGVAPLKKR